MGKQNKITFSYFFLFYFLMLSPLLGVAFQEGIDFYIKKEYDKAQKAFEQLLMDETKTSAAYYNLALSYYQLKKNVEAYYFFKKALWMAPRDPDIQYNVSFLEKSFLDKKLKIFPYRLFPSLAFVSKRESLALSTLCFSFFLLLAAFSLFFKKKFLSFFKGPSVFFLVFFLFFYFNTKDEELFALIAQQNTPVYSGIGDHNVLLYSLYEGDEVMMEGVSVEGWQKIVFQTQKGLEKGWIKKGNLFYGQ